MKSSYKRLGEFISPKSYLNEGMEVAELLGISNQKYFQKSHTNINGMDFSTYRIVRTGQFAFNRATTRNGEKISIAFRQGNDCIVSPSYRIFQVNNENELLSEYLLMWFKRPEFDRYVRFKSHGSAHEFFEYDQMCEVELPIPHITKQIEIVNDYNVIQNRIKLNQQLIQKLEKTAQTIYKQRFIDGKEDINKTTLSHYITTNPQLSIKKNSISTYIEMNDLTTTSMRIGGAIKREFIGGSKFQNYDTLLARITPCLENGKTAFVDILEKGEIAAGSTEFIVMRAKKNISPYWVYCLARDDNFRSYAISSMVGSSGRERVHEKYLENFILPEINPDYMNDFHSKAEPIFKMVNVKSNEIVNLTILQDLLLSKLATIDS